MFSTSEVVDSINHALANGDIKIPEDHRVAFIISSNGKSEAQAAFAMRLGKGWHVGVVTDWSHDAGVSEGISLNWSK